MGRNYFVPEHYFPGRVVKRLGSGYVKDHTPEAHMDVKGLTETEAELEFIKVEIIYHLKLKVFRKKIVEDIFRTILLIS